MRVLSGRSDYLITFITEFFVMLCGILVYRFANNFLHEGSFSEYALVRRALSFIQPVLFIGLGVGLPRYIAFTSKSDKDSIHISYFIAALIILGTVLIPFMLFMLVFKNWFSWVLFGETGMAGLIIPLSLMVLGACMHGIIYSYFRGRRMMLYANFLQILNLAFVMTGAFFMSNNLIDVLNYTGLGWAIISVLFLIKIFVFEKIIISQLKVRLGELLKYGIRRLPGDIFLAALLTLPAFIITHLYGIKTGGYVAFGISVLNMAGAGFSPLSLILLPEASKLFSELKLDALKKKVQKIFFMTFLITCLGLIVFESFAYSILSVYLKQVDDLLVIISKIIFIGSLGYTIYVSLRSILDAYYVKAVNTKNIIISFAFYVIAAGLSFVCFKNSLYIQLFIFAFSFLILGFLTSYEVMLVFKKKNMNQISS